MNKAIGIIIGSVVGAALGGGLIYIYLNKKYDNVFEKETESYRDEINNLNEKNKELNKRLISKLGKEKAEFFEKENVVEVDDPNSLIIEEESDSDESYDVEPTNKSADIRMISKKDYEDDEDYEKEVIEYYMLDQTYLQDEEILDIDEFERVCGQHAITLLKKDKSLARWSNADDNELYIRNEQYCTDYKIIRYHKAYDS